MLNPLVKVASSPGCLLFTSAPPPMDVTGSLCPRCRAWIARTVFACLLAPCSLRPDGRGRPRHAAMTHCVAPGDAGPP